MFALKVQERKFSNQPISHNDSIILSIGPKPPVLECTKQLISHLLPECLRGLWRLISWSQAPCSPLLQDEIDGGEAPIPPYGPKNRNALMIDFRRLYHEDLVVR